MYSLILLLSLPPINCQLKRILYVDGKLPIKDYGTNMSEHLGYVSVRKICSVRYSICNSNDTAVCAVRKKKDRLLVRDYENACYLFLDNMCENPGREYHIAWAGTCNQYKWYRRSSGDYEDLLPKKVKRRSATQPVDPEELADAENAQITNPTEDNTQVTANEDNKQEENTEFVPPRIIQPEEIGDNIDEDTTTEPEILEAPVSEANAPETGEDANYFVPKPTDNSDATAFEETNEPDQTPDNFITEGTGFSEATLLEREANIPKDEEEVTDNFITDPTSKEANKLEVEKTTAFVVTKAEVSSKRAYVKAISKKAPLKLQSRSNKSDSDRIMRAATKKPAVNKKKPAVNKKKPAETNKKSAADKQKLGAGKPAAAKAAGAGKPAGFKDAGSTTNNPKPTKPKPSTLYAVSESYDDHPCPLSCPNVYNPVCLTAYRDNGLYYKFFTFINHCFGDLYYCEHPKQFAVPPDESYERITDSLLSWSYCGSSRYLAFARFAESASSLGHYGWLNGDWSATHIMEPYQRKPGYGK